MNASVYRKNAHEFRTLVQEANSFVVLCSSRELPPEMRDIGGGRLHPFAIRGPELELHESMFSEEEMLAIQKALEILEDKYTLKYIEWATAPERNAELVNAAVDAEKRLAAMKAEEAALAERLDAMRAAVKET